MLRTVNDLIQAIGGNDAACALAGVSRQAVSNWKANGKIPAEYFWIFDAELDGAAPRGLFGFFKSRAG